MLLKFRFILVSILFLLIGSPGMVLGQTPPSLPAYEVEMPVSVDGQLDEKVWSQAEAVTGFRQFEPDEGAPASQKTEVYVLYGAGNVYIGAMLYDENPEAIEQVLGRRDDYNRADWFLVSVDSYFNRRTAYTFGINAAGVQFDALRSGSGGGPGGGGGGPAPPGMDVSWDAVWDSGVRITSEGWVVEMRIPYSMLRFPETEVQTWGIHFMRRIPRLGEQSEWPLIPRAQRDNLVARFGYLTELRNIEPRPNVQVQPYTVTRLNTRESIDSPGELSAETSMDIGGDVKMGIGPNITLDATVNPDFGQVESDPAVLNLTAFETFFDERRPFFVEGIQIYEFSVGPGELLYTRRIGADNPIIGATKVSGRTANGLSFGILGAMTGDSFNPSRNYAVARMSQQIGDYSEAGGILTGFDGPNIAGEGRLQSLSGGADWDIRMLDNRYGIEGFASFTHRRWTAPELETETGFAGKVWARKRQGVWRGFGGLDIFSDRFNPNDLGQLRQNNFVVLISRLEHQINGSRPFGPFQRADASIFGLQRFSYDKGLDLGLSLEFNSRWMLKTFQQVEASASFENIWGGYDLYETRGLGPWARPSTVEFSAEIETDERRNWEIEPELSWTLYGDGGRGYGAGLRGNWNIGTRLMLSTNVEGEWEKNVTAWVSNETLIRSNSGWSIGRESASPDQLGSGDFVVLDDDEILDPVLARVEPYAVNQYYVPVFGARDTRSLDFTLRSTVTFTPKLSLQMYSQLFLARGRYQDFQILQNPDNLAGFEAYPKRSDFALNSLQSNVVLRWEYRPGSTFFLVWTHGRSVREELNPLAPYGPSPYNRPISEQISDTFDIFPDNAFLVKINYTFLY